MPVPDLFNQKVDGVAWRSKPSWYILASEDRTVQPDLHRFVAKRMGATAVELRSSHPDALPAECCDGRHPQRRESRSEIAGGIISGSQICVTGKRVTTFERPPRGGLSFCADLGVGEIALACKALDLNDFRSPGTF